VASPCSNGEATTVSGVVYEPSGRLPLYNVAVFIPNSTPKPFVEGVTCESCGASITGSPISITLTDAQGKFTLSNVPVGANIPLLMQVGRWRRQVTIPTVTACTNTPITDPSLTHLPRNKAEGDLPKMALVSGGADPFECLLLKMIEPSEFTKETADGRVHFFHNNGLTMATPPSEGPALYGHLDALKKYDVVFLPCEGGPYRKEPTETQNIVDYSAAGGRMFTTHFGYVWTAWGAPPFPSTANWTPDARTADRVKVTINQAFPKGKAFASWLENVGAASGGIIQLIDPRKDVGTVRPSTIDWMHGDVTGQTQGSNYNWTPHLTFNVPFNPPPSADGGPGQTCGRVVFSDFHVATDATNGEDEFPNACKSNTDFTAQEKALVFMMFDLASCVQDDSTAPQVCRAIGDSCTTTTDCCSGLSCQTSSGAECNGQQGCSCQSTIG
jgi:hypothetical protein